jgi:hypothetical protein
VTQQPGVQLANYLKVTQGRDRLAIEEDFPSQIQLQRAPAHPVRPWRTYRSENLPGIMVFADITSTGYKGDALALHGILISVRSGRAAVTRSPGGVGKLFEPITNNKSDDSPDAWVAAPCAPGQYTVRIIVTDRGRAIQRKEGPRFTSSGTRC